MAKTCIEMKNFKPAIFHIKKIAELDTNNTFKNTEEALMKLADIYRDQLGDSVRETRVYRKILKLFPENEIAKKALLSKAGAYQEWTYLFFFSLFSC